MRETPQAGYPERTEWNVRDSDGTVIFSILPILTGGSLLTAKLARDYGKPCLHLSKEASDNPVRKLIDFVKEQQIEVLNVAGPRESTEPAIAKFVLDVLTRAWRELGA